MFPMTKSSMLGWVAAVIDTESPSQLNPVVIQMTWISFTADSRCLKGWFTATIGLVLLARRKSDVLPNETPLLFDLLTTYQLHDKNFQKGETDYMLRNRK